MHTKYFQIQSFLYLMIQEALLWVRIIQDNSLMGIFSVTISKNTQCVSSRSDDRHSGSGRNVLDPLHLHPALPQNSLCPLTWTVQGTDFLQDSSGRRTLWIAAPWGECWTPLACPFRPTRCKVPEVVQYWNNYQLVPKHSASSWWSKLSERRSKGEETACWNIQTSFGVRGAVNCNTEWKRCDIKRASLPCILSVHA